MKYLLPILLFLVLFINSGHTDTDRREYAEIFPKSWDSAGVLKDKKVLTWVQLDDTLRHCWYRQCIVAEIGCDTLGQPVYSISQYICYHPDDPYFINGGSWNLDISEVHAPYDPDKIRFSSKYELVRDIRTYDHQPDSTAVYGLIKEWSYTLCLKGYPTAEEGVDMRLWREVLGWSPDKTRLVNKELVEFGTFQGTYFGRIRIR